MLNNEKKMEISAMSAENKNKCGEIEFLNYLS